MRALRGRPPARSAGNADRGALSLSYVIVLPFVFILLLAMVQASLWWLGRDAALAAARQGADAARQLDAARSAGPAAAIAFARQAGNGYLFDPAASLTGSTATTVAVTVTAQVSSLVPGLPIHVAETAQAPVEEFKGDSRMFVRIGGSGPSNSSIALGDSRG